MSSFVSRALALGLCLLPIASCLGDAPRLLEDLDAGADATGAIGSDAAPPNAGGAMSDVAPDGTNAPVDAADPMNVLDGAPNAAGDGGICKPGSELLCNNICVPNDVRNCGSCGHDCTNLTNVTGTVMCVQGACSFGASACKAGFAPCTSNPDSGCETAITTATHCGACGSTCSGGTPLCSGSGGTYGCVSGCPSSAPTLCGTTCSDTNQDAQNCKTCGNVCTTTVAHATANCANGSCGFQCTSSYPNTCAGGCVDFNSDNGNCGGCGASFACTGGKTCQSGVCACTTGTHDCGGTCSSNTSTASCGPTSCTPCGTPTSGTVSCNGTSCVPSCAGTLTLCGNACVDLTSDGKNCGACGHSCLGGMCTGSQCQPVALGSDPNGSYVAAIALDSANLYWIQAQNAGMNTGILNKCPLATGCTAGAQVLATNFPGGASFTPNLAVDATNLYWSNGSILKCATSGCTTPTVYYAPPSGSTAAFVQSDGSNLYWSEITSGGGVTSYNIYSCPSSGCPGAGPTLVMIAPSINEMKLLSSFLYVSAVQPASGGSTPRQILKCSTAGCSNTPTVLLTTSSTGGHFLRPLAVDSAHVYWFDQDNGQVAECSAAGCSSPTVLASTTATVAPDFGIAVDSTNVYWAGNGELYKCAIGGCSQTPTPVLQGLSNPVAFGADSAAIYYEITNGSGAMIFNKVAK